MFHDYEQLIKKIDRFGEALKRKYAQSFACRAGCAGCCVAGIRVWRVEFDHIRRTHLDKRGMTKPSSTTRAGRCAWQGENDRCTIYDVRPVVCRLWGLPLFIPEGKISEWTSSAIDRSVRAKESGAEGTLTCCELNFTAAPALEDLPLADAVNYEIVIQTLAAINHVYCKGEGIDPAERLSLEAVLSGKLSRAD